MATLAGTVSADGYGKRAPVLNRGTMVVRDRLSMATSAGDRTFRETPLLKADHPLRPSFVLLRGSLTVRHLAHNQDQMGSTPISATKLYRGDRTVTVAPSKSAIEGSTPSSPAKVWVVGLLGVAVALAMRIYRWVRIPHDPPS